MISVPRSGTVTERARAMRRRATACRGSAVVLQRTGHFAEAGQLLREATDLERQARALETARAPHAA